MTETAKEIFAEYEVRKTKEQKQAFRDYAVKKAESLGYSARTLEQKKNCTNIVIGDTGSAKVVYTAHYDTCPAMPFPNFITPKCIPLYILYQIALVLLLFAVPYTLIICSRFVSMAVGYAMVFTAFAMMMAVLYLMMYGPANKHTANDNTSGVTLLFDIMEALPEEKRGEAAFILFDLEERGLVGSKLYAKSHEYMHEKLLINFDCVSDGHNILFVVNKNAEDKIDTISMAFPSDDTYSVEVLPKRGIIYPSDQRSFKCGVGAASLLKTKNGVLYMNKIHTGDDTVYDEGNIEFLKKGAVRLIEML